MHPKATAKGPGEQKTETELRPDKPLNPRYVQQMVARLAERAGIEKRVTPHVLRHTAATLLLKGHRNLREVQEFLGHANVATTQVYTHVLAEDLVEAVDALYLTPRSRAKVNATKDIGPNLLLMPRKAERIEAKQRAALARILSDDGHRG